MTDMSKEFVMIPNVPDPRAIKAAASSSPTEAMTHYFDARLNSVSATSLRHDRHPLSALDQMYAYFEA